MKSLLLLLLFLVILSTAAFATQLNVSEVSTLNPSPVGYVFTDSNTGAYNQGATLSVSAGSLTSVSANVYCPGHAKVSLTVTVYDSAGASISTGSGSSNNCRNALSVAMTLSPTVSMSSVAKVEVDLA